MTSFMTRRLAWAAAVTVAALGCADSTAPNPASSFAAARQTVSTTTRVEVLRFAAYAPALETYDTTFTAVQGVASQHYIRFRDAFRSPYLKVEIPADAQFVDARGKPLSNGTNVPLRIRADARTLEVDLGPHGSTFGVRSGTPAVLTMFFGYADLAQVDLAALGTWYRASLVDGWESIASTVDVGLFWVRADLWHFSNYAVAYAKRK